MKANTLISILLLVALAAVGCAEDHDHDHEEGDVDAELCEHMADGPNVAVTAGATADATDLPDVTAPHTRYDITLVDDGNGTMSGWVQFASSAAADHIIALDTTDAVSVLDASDQPIAITTVSPNPDCPGTVALHHTVPLPVGTVRFQITGSSASVVKMVIEEAPSGE